MGVFVKKPVAVEAVQWDGVVFLGGRPGWLDVVPDNGSVPCNVADVHTVVERGDKLLVGTLEGTAIAQPNDWIIRGVKGEIYPCKPNIFEETYSPALPGDELKMQNRVKGAASRVYPDANGPIDSVPMRDEGDAFAPPTIPPMPTGLTTFEVADASPDALWVSRGFAQELHDRLTGGKGRQWEGPAYEYAVTWGETAIQPRDLSPSQRIDILSLAMKGREGWSAGDIIGVARELEDYVRDIRNVRVPAETEPERKPEPDEYGHPHGTVFMPPVGDGLVEHPAAEPPAPVAGDARAAVGEFNYANQDAEFSTSEDLSSGNAHG